MTTVIIGEVGSGPGGGGGMGAGSAGAGAGAAPSLDRAGDVQPAAPIAGAPERRGVRRAVLRALCASGGGACRRGTRRPRRLIAGARAR